MTLKAILFQKIYRPDFLGGFMAFWRWKTILKIYTMKKFFYGQLNAIMYFNDSFGFLWG
jgi:hypothetical protein